MKAKHCRILCLLGCILIPLLAFSQDGEDQLFDADITKDEELLFTEVPTVSTVTRISQKSTESPFNIYVITSDDIRRMGAQNITDVLRRVPGVDVGVIDGFQSQVGMRGSNSFNSTKALILLNGRRVGVDIFGVTFWNLLPVAIEDIERIEVLRGPGTTYGANALSGVVNIITKDSHTDPGGTVSSFGGTNDVWDAHASYGFLGLEQSARISANRYESHAYSNDSITRYTQALGTAELLNAEKSRLSLSTGWNEFEGVADVPLGPKRTFLEGLLGFVSLQFDQDLSDASSWMARVSLDHIDVTLPTLADAPTLQHDRLSAEFQHAFQLNDWNQIVWGLETEALFTQDEDALELYAPNTTDFYAAHFLDKIRLSEKWLFYLGGRFEDHDITGVNASPMASLVYHPTDNDVWRLSYSTAHRSPSFFESYANIHAPELPGRHFDGNQSARPEFIQSVDLGYQAFRFSNRLQLMADLFAHRIARHIDLNDRIEPENGDYLENFIDNLGNSDAYGFELSALGNPTSSTRLWASYSFQDVDFEKDGIGLASPAQHKVSMGGGFDFNQHWSFDAWMYYQTDSEFIEETSDLGGRNLIPIDNYSLLNLKLSYRLTERNLEFDIRGLNLIDDGHREFPGEPIARQFLFGLTYRF